MDQSLYLSLDKVDEETVNNIVRDIKDNLSDKLIAEMKTIIRNYNKVKKNKKNKKNKKSYVAPSLTVDFN